VVGERGWTWRTRERGKSLRRKGRVDINRVEAAKTRLLRKERIGAYISEK
jgi:hypothetical protein